MFKKRALFLFMMFLLSSAGSVFAAPDAEGLPVVNVPGGNVNKILSKPKVGEHAAVMQWIRPVGKTQIKNVCFSAVFDFDKSKRLKDDENLVYCLTELVDRGFEGSGIHLTPYVDVKNRSVDAADTLRKMHDFDAGLSIVVDKQDHGEVVLRGFIEDMDSQKSLANYYSRASYNEKAGFEAKKDAFRKALHGFVKELMDFNNGLVK